MKSRSSLTIGLNQLSLSINFPNKFTIKVKEYDIVAYYVSGESHYPILSSGQLETSSVSLVSLPETYISVLFNDSEQIKTFTSELAQISPELKAAIQKVELAPSKVHIRFNSIDYEWFGRGLGSSIWNE